MPTYLVETPEYGTIRKTADNIADARRWAKSAFGLGPRAVTRELTYRRCEWCGSSKSLCDCDPPRWKVRARTGV